MQYDFHPLASGYERLEGDDFEEMVELMRDRGFDPRSPIWLYEGQILDGCNRYRAAEAAGVEPVYQQYEGTAEEAADFVYRQNDIRRHSPEERKAARRRSRVERIAALRQAGQSFRAIAESEGISTSQAFADAQAASGVQGGCTPESKPGGQGGCPPGNENGKTKGKDGKTYPATKPKPPETIFCRECRTTGIKEGCKECKRWRKAAKDAAKIETNREPGDEDEPVSVLKDAEGEEVPEGARQAFVVADTLTEICREMDALIRRVEEISKGPGGRLIRFDSFKQQIKDAKGNLWANRATHVCPYCHGHPVKGKPCECCKGDGWTAHHVWKAAPGNNAKAK